jgi:hypothetical protein
VKNYPSEELSGEKLSYWLSGEILSGRKMIRQRIIRLREFVFLAINFPSKNPTDNHEDNSSLGNFFAGKFFAE